METASVRVKRPWLIWVGVIVTGGGVLTDWVKVFKELEDGSWTTHAILSGLDLTKPPFNTVLSLIAIGLVIVIGVLAFFVARKSASARFLSILIALGGLAAVASAVAVYGIARPGQVWPGFVGLPDTRNEIEPGLYITAAGGVVLFLGGLIARVRASGAG